MDRKYRKLCWIHFIDKKQKTEFTICNMPSVFISLEDGQSLSWSDLSVNELSLDDDNGDLMVSWNDRLNVSNLFRRTRMSSCVSRTENNDFIQSAA